LISIVEPSGYASIEFYTRKLFISKRYGRIQMREPQRRKNTGKRRYANEENEA
jgi:hypothetical protein